MASIINAATSGGLVTTADTSGVLQLQTASTTAVTVDASQNVGVGVTPSGNFLLQAGNFTSVAARSFKLMSLYGGISGGGYPQFGYNFRSTSTTSTYNYDLSDTASAIEFQDGFLFKIAASGTAGNAITFTQALALEKDKSLALQGATPASGTGITFPATQSASSDANTLDDYEEGTWTPSVSGVTTTGSPAYAGVYTKIGNIVTVNFYSTTTSGTTYTTTAGSSQSGGLPFTTKNTNSSFQPWTGSCGNGNTSDGGACAAGGGATTVFFLKTLSATGGIAFTLVYQV